MSLTISQKLFPLNLLKSPSKATNDFNDVEAIAEAANRSNMYFVPIKSEKAQAVAAIHRFISGCFHVAYWSRIVGVRNVSRPQGHTTMKCLFQWLVKQSEPLHPMLIQDKKLKQLLDDSDIGQLLRTTPSVDDMTVSACLAAVNSPSAFKNGRHMAAWLGLVPKRYSASGKPKLLGIIKRSNTHLRTLFIHGARAILSRADMTGSAFGNWLV